MNQHLQTILNLIQQAEHLTEEEKTALSKAAKNADKELEITAFKLERTEKVKRTTAILLEETIEELENKRKAVEAQNRELEIEAALERVRAIALGMKAPADMLEVCSTIAIELNKLGVKEIRNVQTAIFYESRGTYMNYEYYAKHNKTIITETSFTNHKMHREFAAQMIKGKGEFFTTYISKPELPDWIAYQKTTNVFIDDYLYTASSLNYYWFSLGPVALGISTYEPLKEEETNLFRRFLKVFELSYTRYLDIEQAIAQARESQIQLALERARAQSMMMQHSTELDDTLRVFHEQVLHLNISSAFSFLWLPDEDKDRHIFWAAWAENNSFKSKAIDYPLDRNEPATALCLVDWKSNEPVVAYHVPPASVNNYFAAWNELIAGVEELKPKNFSGGLYYVEAFMKYGCFGVMVRNTLQEDEKKILHRFAVEFERAYTRFLDLQKAEEQARESQIQLALERVRARTMAMQKSDELSEAVYVLFQQFKELRENPDQATIGVINEDEKVIEYWVTMYGKPINKVFKFSIDEPNVTGKIYKAWKENKKSLMIDLSGYALTEFMTYRAGKGGAAINPDEKRRIINVAFFSKGLLNVQSNEERSEESIKLLERFASVFDQTYTRFLDLQKAEAQARESQIQLALERVRARTMAMQHSDELKDAAALLFQQVKSLGAPAYSCGYNIWEKDEKEFTSWMSAQDGSIINGVPNIPLTEDANFIRYVESKQKGEEFFILELRGERMQEHYEYLKTIPSFRASFDYAISVGFDLPETQIHHLANFSQGNLLFITLEPCPEFHDVFKRFTAVFEQTYTRFLDLQKAEAQSREAQIETALERVRSRSLAMRKSEEIIEVAKSVFEKLSELNIEINTAFIIIFKEGSRDSEWWLINRDDQQYARIFVKYIDLLIFRDQFEAKEQGKELFSATYHGEEKKQLFRYLFTQTDFKYAPPERQKYIFESEAISISTAMTNKIAIQITRHTETPFLNEENEIVKRFTKVFDQSYIRFLDLQKAEAQSRESQIEAALERVRSKTLAMQKSDELAATSAVLFQQLIHLGISPNRLYISIIKDDVGNTEFWITDEDGSKVSMAYEDNLNNNASFKKMYEGWKQQKKSLVIDMQGKELQDYFHHLGEELHVPFKGGLTQKRRLQYIAYFSKGFIGMASPDEQPEATIQLLERFAYVLNLTFTRFNDLQIAEAHAIQAEQDLIEIKSARQKAEDALVELQSTQKQLIQSEKMASLGELTAGIAHEIQNPLNFVNNFSEISKELLDEMKAALESGDKAEAEAIANDIIQNLEKINHHGKRADAIVKGMLQHSRKSEGKKEPTDINALCDEYLRLSYHGLRAKDKSFNADIKTNFESSIDKINIVPQDIGRVLLNLFNNAFYAVNEKLEADYKPLVSIQTKKINDRIEIIVSDNGNGIPSNIMDKIFQPFFTTKPTGEGTGLGLSLSYDIIKAHGGEIKVETKQNEGTTFIIVLPL